MKALISLILISLLLLSSVQADEYKFGVTPWQRGQTEDDIHRLYKPMLDWLSQETGHDFIIVSTKDYRQMINYLADGTLHIVSISPVPYILAKRKNPNLNVLVTELSPGVNSNISRDVYFSYILARKDNAIVNSITDLRNKIFGFVRRESTSGFIYPVHMFNRSRINYQSYFKKFYFLGSHPSVTDAIAAGSLDAGATWSFNWNKAKEKHGDIFKAVWKSPPIPNLGIVAHPYMPKPLQDKLKALLLSVDPELLTGLPASGFVSRDDSFYNGVRTIMDTIQ